MRVIDKLVDIANNGTSEIIQYFRYYNRNAKQFDSCMLSLENLIYKLNNGTLDINDEIKVIDEDVPKEDTQNYIFKHYLYKDKKIEKIKISSRSFIRNQKVIINKINEIIDKINGDSDE